MKLCFNAGPEPMEEYFSFAQESGFPWMELSCNNPNNFLNTWDSKRIDNIKRLRDKSGVRYGLHSASFVNAAEIEPTVKVAAQQHLLDYVKLAHDLEAEYIVLHFGYHWFGNYLTNTPYITRIWCRIVDANYGKYFNCERDRAGYYCINCCRACSFKYWSRIRFYASY